jgi:hypothetical protein
MYIMLFEAITITQTPELIVMRFGMYVMPSEVISTAYIINPFHLYYYTAASRIFEVLTLILWHVDPLLGNNRKISNYTTAVAK